MAVDEELLDLSIEEIADGVYRHTRYQSTANPRVLTYLTTELPESSPRYVVLSHELVSKPCSARGGI